MANDRSAGDLETLAATPGTDATMASKPGASGIEATIASAPPTSAPEARGADYTSLVTVDPKHYVVGAELARGGMGRILTARDRRVGRTVAIKELLHASASTRARFEREARITARLQHPSIVNLLEAGTWPNGEPFYAMKLVKGEALDQVIARCTTLPQRLALLPTLIAAVDALAYAHSEGVIHRDLKPGNVLVGSFGEVVVIDWGLAKDLRDASDEPDVDVSPRRDEAPDATVVGSIMGTPAYMPPEQAAGEPVDERADVYALGAMLYHALSGRSPYTASRLDDLLARVIAGPPPSLAEAAPEAPPDLVTVVDKAMSHAAAARYPTARELADDLKKFQTGQLVGAHRYSIGALLRRWVRRHRTPIAVGAIAAVGLAITATVLITRVVDERERAQANQARAEELMDFMLFDLRDKLTPVGRLEVLEGVAEKATRYYDAVGASDTDVDLRRHAASLQVLGDVLRARGDGTSALARYREALALHDRRGEGTEVARERANSRIKIASVLLDQGDSAGAIAEFETAQGLLVTAGKVRGRALVTSLLGDALLHNGDIDAALPQLRAAVELAQTEWARTPNERELAHELCGYQLTLGQALTMKGENASAIEELERALATCQRIVDAEPRNAAWGKTLAAVHSQLATAFYRRDDSAGAVAQFQLALAIRTRISEADPRDLDAEHSVYNYQSELASALARAGQPEKALALYRQAIEGLDRLTTRDPKQMQWRRNLMIARSMAAEVSAGLGDLDGAISGARDSAATAQALLDADADNPLRRRDLMSAVEMVGELLSMAGKHAEALEAHTAALGHARAAFAAEPDNRRVHREVGVLEQRIAGDLWELKRRDEAMVTLRASLATAQAVLAKAPDDPALQRDVGVSHQMIGGWLAMLGDPSGARASYLAGLVISERLATGNKDALHLADLAENLEFLAGVHDTLHERVEAREVRTRARAVLTQQLALDPDDADAKARLQRIDAAR